MSYPKTWHETAIRLWPEEFKGLKEKVVGKRRKGFYTVVTYIEEVTKAKCFMEVKRIALREHYMKLRDISDGSKIKVRSFTIFQDTFFITYTIR